MHKTHHLSLNQLFFAPHSAHSFIMVKNCHRNENALAVECENYLFIICCYLALSISVVVIVIELSTFQAINNSSLYRFMINAVVNSFSAIVVVVVVIASDKVSSKIKILIKFSIFIFYLTTTTKKCATLSNLTFSI
jgi:hypothetical protein